MNSPGLLVAIALLKAKRSWMIGLGIASLLTGCRPAQSELRRIEVTGKVDRSGAPVSSGTVSFLPVRSLDGPAANGLIRDGRYRFDQSNGLVPGKHRVVIQLTPSKPEVTASSHGDQRAGRVADPHRNRWEYEVLVPAEPGFEKDFVLE